MKADKDTQYNIYISSSLETGSDYYAHAIYCSENRKAAVDDAFNGRHIDATYDCDLSGMMELREFIRKNNLYGSPIAILGNGEVKVGYKVKSYSM